jgi:hypothetical protein
MPMPSCATPRPFALAPLVAALALSFGHPSASAASFTVTGADTTAKTLGSGAGQTGTITATGLLSLSDSSVAVTISGNNATLTNLGTIQQTGTGRAVRDNTGVTGLTINNGALGNASALMQTADADVIQMNKSPAGVLLNNYGQLISLNASAGGAQAVDFTAIVSGANTINNYAGGLMKAYEADAVRPGVNGTVYNAGTILSITATGSSSDGIDLQNNSGAQITNDTTGLVEGGRHGITGGAVDATVSFVASIMNKAGGIIRGDNGSGINLDGFNAKQVVTIVNAGSIIGNGITGDGDGVDVDGLVTLTNTGVIRSVNAFSSLANGLAYSEGITVGGGTITNSGTIEGLVAAGNTNAVGRGITLAGNDIMSGPLIGTREAIYGNAVIVNNAGGLIRGQSDSAIVVGGPASGFTVTITNNAGASIVGGGSSSAAIQTGADNDTLTNGGTIDGASSGKAIDLGAGNNSLRIVGGSAVVLGDISGGVGGMNTMTIAPGAGNAFAYAGAISNFASVEVQSGTVSFSGISGYTGTTVLSGGTLILNGADRLAAGSSLALAGGTLSLLGASGVNGQSFAALALSGHSTILLNGSAITFGSLGSIASGASLTIDGFIASSTTDYAFRLLGNFADNADFRNLLAATTIDGLTSSYRFDGIYTDVSANVAAVPEPSSIALLLAGFGVMGIVLRRRRGTAEARAQA